jgi:hypothetical protein
VRKERGASKAERQTYGKNEGADRARMGFKFQGRHCMKRPFNWQALGSCIVVGLTQHSRATSPHDERGGFGTEASPKDRRRLGVGLNCHDPSPLAEDYERILYSARPFSSPVHAMRSFLIPYFLSCCIIICSSQLPWPSIPPCPLPQACLQ